MKKFALILGLVLSLGVNACAKNDVNKQEFVNPIFNKTLFAYGRTSWNTILTPNSVTESPDDFSNPDAYIEKHNCKLQVNKRDYIKFLCNVCYQDILIADKINCSRKNILYKIADDGLIEKQSFRLHDQEPYSIDHLITKP